MKKTLDHLTIGVFAKAAGVNVTLRKQLILQQHLLWTCPTG